MENLVGYARRNARVPVPEVASFDELNAHLLAWCAQERRRLADRWVQESAALRSLPPVGFRPALTVLAAVSPSSLVRVDRNRYSVPGRFVGRTLLVRVFTERIEGWSVRRISRQLGLARQTVRKALSSAEPPRYQREHARPRPVVGSFEPVIKRWLAEDREAPRKQRHTAKRIYDRLVAEHGFTGHEGTVRRTVARLRPKTPEVFIPLAVGWGQQAQVDWGQAVVRIAGQSVVAHLFCLRLRTSQVPFVWAAPTEKLEAFLNGHVRAFAWLGGVPATCLYDCKISVKI